MYGIFYDAVSSSNSVRAGKNDLHNRQRALEEVKTKCQGYKSYRSSAFCAIVGWVCVCVCGGGGWKTLPLFHVVQLGSHVGMS